MRKRIKQRLSNYKIPINTVDTQLPKQISAAKNVAVIGGGIAGISAASLLAERGFTVDLYEKENFLGGKVGSWEFESKGETLRTEHGFHAFFKQYFNLLQYLKEIGAHKHLIPIDDYVIFFDKDQRQGFKDIDKTPGYNILSLRKYGVFNWLTMINPLSISFLNLLKFDFKKTFKQFDKEHFESFAKRTLMPKKMRLIFNSFARAFFAEPHNMSMAELIKGFHFYFLSNDLGLLYDVLDDDFQTSFIDYCIQFLEKNNARIHLNTPIQSLQFENEQFIVNGKNYDYCVMATEVNATKSILAECKAIEQYPTFKESISTLQNSGHYAVLRLWTDAFEADKDLPFFIFTDRLDCLDSVTIYHKMEKTSAEWSTKNNGGIFELHSYAVPENMDKETCRKALLEEFYHYFPELKTMEIKHEFYQFRNDFPAFHTGLHAKRPTIKTAIPNLYLAGDWVKMDNCTMLMEGAFTSGALAANAILTQEGLQEKALFQVPPKGLLA